MSKRRARRVAAKAREQAKAEVFFDRERFGEYVRRLLAEHPGLTMVDVTTTRISSD